MTMPEPRDFDRAMDATWPAAKFHTLGPWCLREGQGGGKRVSAATALGPVSAADIDMAEQKHRDLGQVPLFCLRPGDEALDAALDARGYRIVDPVVLMAGPVAGFAPPEYMRSFPHWPPLALAREIWFESGIGAGRQAVMERVAGQATAILARASGGADRATGVAFAAVSGDIAMIHAVEVLPEHRRKGSARNILCAAAQWAGQNGAEWLALAVTRENAGARALYEQLGMSVVGQYHYRSA